MPGEGGRPEGRRSQQSVTGMPSRPGTTRGTGADGRSPRKIIPWPGLAGPARHYSGAGPRRGPIQAPVTRGWRAGRAPGGKSRGRTGRSDCLRNYSKTRAGWRSSSNRNEDCRPEPRARAAPPVAIHHTYRPGPGLPVTPPDIEGAEPHGIIAGPFPNQRGEVRSVRLAPATVGAPGGTVSRPRPWPISDTGTPLA